MKPIDPTKQVACCGYLFNHRRLIDHFAHGHMMNGSVAIVEATQVIQGLKPVPKLHFLKVHEEEGTIPRHEPPVEARPKRKAEVMESLGVESKHEPNDDCIVCHKTFYKEHARQIYCPSCQPCGWCKHRGGKHADGCKRKNAAAIRASKIERMKSSPAPKPRLVPAASPKNDNPYLQVVEDLNEKIEAMTKAREMCIKLSEQFGKVPSFV